MKMKKISLTTLAPPKLVHQCVDKVFQLVSLSNSHIGFHHGLLQLEPILSELPRELQSLLIKMAEQNLDHTYSVRTLLSIWYLCVDSGDVNEICTPRYLYNDEEGRKLILKKMETMKHADKVSKLSFFMYSFYSHLSGRSKTSDCSAGFLLEDEQLQDPRLMLSPLEHEMMCQILARFKNVTALVLPTIANSELLENVAVNMGKLKILDVSCSTNLTDYGLVSLVGANSNCKQSLAQIYLEGTSVTMDGIFMLLANLPALEICESTLLERVLDTITDRPLNLRKITIGRFWKTDETLKNLPQICPQLCQILLLNVSQKQCQLLANFKDLSHLKHVHLGQAKFQDLIQVLPKFGPQMTSLTYSNFAETVNFTQIMKHCQNLECFGLNAENVVVETGQHLVLPQKLSEIRLNVHAFIPKVIWEMIIQHCTNLLYLDMTPGLDLTDDNLRQVMKLNPECLLKIKSFIVRGRHRGGDVSLTELSIEALLARCDQLKCIGDCSTWAVNPHSFKEFMYFT